jgi:hypothetical protein
MNWEAIGAISETLGVVAIVITLIYVAVQVRHAKESTADQNRLERSRAVREMAVLVCENPELRYDQIRNWGLEKYYEDLGAEEGMTPERASGVDWANSYYFWMYWGQYSSTTQNEDLEELKHVIGALLDLPGMRKTWETSPMTKPELEPRFVEFVDKILKSKMSKEPPIKGVETNG